jgi:hypothetical protein
MADKKANKKIFLIPGWMDVVSRYGYASGLDIWLSGTFPKMKKHESCVVGHSLGANFVLVHCDAEKCEKIILVNPLLLKRSKLGWFVRWFKNTVFERDGFSLKRAETLMYFFSNLRKAFELLRDDFGRILDDIPADKIIIIRGKEDLFYCDEETAEFVKQKGIRLIEIEGIGHNWRGRRFNKIIDELVAEI